MDPQYAAPEMSYKGNGVIAVTFSQPRLFEREDPMMLVHALREELEGYIPPPFHISASLKPRYRIFHDKGPTMGTVVIAEYRYRAGDKKKTAPAITDAQIIGEVSCAPLLKREDGRGYWGRQVTIPLANALLYAKDPKPATYPGRVDMKGRVFRVYDPTLDRLAAARVAAQEVEVFFRDNADNQDLQDAAGQMIQVIELKAMMEKHGDLVDELYRQEGEMAGAFGVRFVSNMIRQELPGPSKVRLEEMLGEMGESIARIEGFPRKLVEFGLPEQQ